MKVMVSKQTMIDLLVTNRDKHRAIFEQALEGYRKECIRVLEKNISAFKAGRRESLYLHEQIPTDHTRDYNTVIGLMELADGTQVELSAAEYRQYVLDDWEWKQQWVTSNSKYTETPSE